MLLTFVGPEAKGKMLDVESDEDIRRVVEKEGLSGFEIVSAKGSVNGKEAGVDEVERASASGSGSGSGEGTAPTTMRET